MKKYRCIVCEWIYDPAVGDPDGGIAPGAPFEEIPDDWACPVCGVGKSNSEEVEEQPGKRGAAPKRSAPRHFGEPFQKNRGGVYNLRRFLLFLSVAHGARLRIKSIQ